MNDKPTREAEAYQMLTDLLHQAEEVHKRFVAAGLPLPPPLSRLRGIEAKHGTGDQDDDTLDQPTRPEVATDDWICVPVGELVIQDLVLGLMRGLDAPTRPNIIYKSVVKKHPDTVAGTVYNIFPRLKGKLLEQKSDGDWVLIDPSMVPLIDGDHAWGPRTAFADQSVTVYRRNMILRQLAKMPSGLTAMQLLDTLRDCKAPVDKDIIKGDMIALQAKSVVKKGFQRKWSLVTDKNAKG
jgi:hypothetical protein